MSEVNVGEGLTDKQYQRLKARALEQQREKDAELRRELAAKAKREAQATKEAEEVRSPLSRAYQSGGNV